MEPLKYPSSVKVAWSQLDPLSDDTYALISVLRVVVFMSSSKMTISALVGACCAEKFWETRVILLTLSPNFPPSPREPDTVNPPPEPSLVSQVARSPVRQIIAVVPVGVWQLDPRSTGSPLPSMKFLLFEEVLRSRCSRAR